MAMNRMNGAAILSPEEVGQLLIIPTVNQCQASKVSTVVMTGNAWYRIPIIEADPSAGWVAEEQEIPVTNAQLAEIDVHFSKLAGLSIVSNELAMDSTPGAIQSMGDGLARKLSVVMDQTFFGNLGSAVAPSGLESLTTTNVVDASAGLTSLDPFAAAMNNAESLGTQVTAFVASPADALTLSTMKQFGATGSNMPLLGSDPTQPTRRSIFGVPLLVSPGVTPGHIWGIPQDRVTMVIREAASIAVDSSVFFTSDRTAVRAVMRAGFAFVQPEAITKIVTKTAPAPAKTA